MENSRLVGHDRKAIIIQLTTLYNHAELKKITESTQYFEADGKQGQETTSGSSTGSQEQESEAPVGTGSQNS